MTTPESKMDCSLLPCPFDGGEAYLLAHGMGHRSVGCLSCRMETARYVTPAAAIAAWNTRAPVRCAHGAEVGYVSAWDCPCHAPKK